ncbi:MAG: CvpA family protein [bacterium]|nr:CvpA family protein [bacterium]
MNWLLLIVVLFVILSIVEGYRKGFIKTVFSVFAMAISLIVASVGSPVLCHMLIQNEAVYSYIDRKVADTLDIDSKISSQSEQEAYIEKLMLPESVKNELLTNNKDEVTKLLNTSNFSGYVSGYITCMILNAISYIALFLIMMIIVRILANVLDIISRLPVLNSINKIGGIFVGALKSIIVIWLFFVILTVFSGSEFGQSMFAMINDSVLLSYIYNNNMLMSVVLEVVKALF